jgi:hypothetical protein
MVFRSGVGAHQIRFMHDAYSSSYVLLQSWIRAYE